MDRKWSGCSPIVVDQPARAEEPARGRSLQGLERDVLLGGLSNRKIGDRIQLSESRVKNIVQCLFSKASVWTRGQLVRVAMDGSWDAARDLLKRLPEPHESSEPGPS